MRTNPYTRLLFAAALALIVTCYPAGNACADYTTDWTGPDGIKHETTFNDDGTPAKDVWTDANEQHIKLFDHGTATEEDIYWGNPVYQWTQCFYENSRMSSCTTYNNDLEGTVLDRRTYTYSDDGRTVTVTFTDGNGNFVGQMTTTKDPNGQMVMMKATDTDGVTYVEQFDSSGGIWALTKTGPGGAAKRSDAHVDQDVVDNQGVGQGRPKLPGGSNQPNAETNTALALHPGQSIKGLKRTQDAAGSTGTGGDTAALGRVGYTYSDEGRTETGTVTDGNGNLEFQMTTTKDPNGQISWFWWTDKDGVTYVGQVDSSGGMWALTKTGPGGAAKRSDAHVDQDVVDNQGVGQGRPKLPGVPNQPNAEPNTALALHPGQSINGLKRTQGAGGSIGTGAGTAEVTEPSMGSATGGTAGVGGTHGSGGQAGAGNKRKIIWQKPSSAATDALTGGNSASGGTAGVAAGPGPGSATGATVGVASNATGQGGRDVPQREPTPNKKKIIRQRSSSAMTNTGASGGSSATGATAGVAGSSSGQAGAGNKRKIIWQKSSSAATKTGSSSSGGNSAVGATAGVAGPGTGTATGGTAGVANTSRGEPQRQPTPKPTPSNRKKKDSYSTHRAEDG
jgi:hypothetical protein